MLPAIELLLCLIGVFVVVCVFIMLKNSRLVSRATHAIVDTPPESDDELIAQLDTSLDAAGQRADQIASEAAAAQARAAKLDRYKKSYGG
jgi:hypothetical protein